MVKLTSSRTCGGISDQTVPQATGWKTGDHTVVRSMKGYGYLLVEALHSNLETTMFAVDQTTKAKTACNRVSVDLATNQVS